MVSNREKALDITSPTFGNWDLWDYDFERRGRVVCNQLVAGDDEDSEILEAVMEVIYGIWKLCSMTVANPLLVDMRGYIITYSFLSYLHIKRSIYL